MMRIGWFIDQAATYEIASVRYRAVYPALGLLDLGHESLFFREAAALRARLASLDALVIVKRLDMEALQIALDADDRGVPIFVDLCDDVLMHGYRARRVSLHRMVFAALAEVADGLVAPTAPLLARLARHPGVAMPAVVIPDAMETPTLYEQGSGFFRQRCAGDAGPSASGRPGGGARRLARCGAGLVARAGKAYGRLRTKSPAEIAFHARRRAADLLERAKRRLRKPRAAASPCVPPPLPVPAFPKTAAQERKIVVWFGNHGAPYSDAGVMTLMRAAPALTAVDRDVPLSLLVVSDSAVKTEILAARLPFPVRHVAWSAKRMEAVLGQASVFLMTRGNDDFSTFKSPNRALKALFAGVPVVADHAPGLGELDGLIRSGDLDRDLRAVLAAPAPASRPPADALGALGAMQVPAVAAQWSALLCDACLRRRRKHRGRGLRNRKIAILVDLVQDVEIALPLIEAAASANLQPVVVATARALLESPRFFSRLVALEIIPTVMDPVSALDPDLRWLRGAAVLVTLAETSAAPHRVAHALTRNANAAGVLTVTLQHGLENVGLTCRDLGVGSSVSILSDRICIWGRAEDLPVWHPGDVRTRVRPAGRVSSRGSGLPLPVPRGSQIVGVFENLHWERYSGAFRDRFLRDLQAAAAARPGLLFVLRPHPAGRWAVNGRAALGGMPPNLVLADPEEPAWAEITAVDLVRASRLVLTTPSTVALDAAEAKVPVAILGDTVEPSPVYAPLRFVRSAVEWTEVIDAVMNGDTADFDAAGRAFAERHSIGTGAERRIVADVAAHIEAVEYRR